MKKTLILLVLLLSVISTNAVGFPWEETPSGVVVYGHVKGITYSGDIVWFNVSGCNTAFWIDPADKHKVAALTMAYTNSIPVAINWGTTAKYSSTTWITIKHNAINIRLGTPQP